MADRLYIEEQEVDLTPETVISITLQVNDLGELVDRQANYTNQFKVPKTSRNRAIFESIELVTGVSTIPYRKLKAKVIKEGIEVVSKGYAIVESTSTEYNVTVYGGLVDFFRLLEGKNLRDLNLDALIHTWDFNAVLNAISNTTGYIYPIVKYAPGSLQIVGDDYNTDYALPCLFVHTIIEKIVEGTGFTLTGDFLTDENYLKAIFQVGTDTWITSGKVLHADTVTDVVAQNAGSPYGAVQLNYTAQDSSSGDPINRTGAFDVLGWWTFNDEYVLGQDYNSPLELKVNIHLELEYWYHGGYPEKLNLQLFGGGSIPVWQYTTQNLNSGTSFFTFDIELPPGRYVSGSGIRLKIKSLIHPSNDASSLTIKTGSYIEAEVATAPLTIGGPVNLALNLPDMLQVDFFKGIAQLFGLIVIPKSVQGTIEVGSLSIIERNKAIALDWSEKVHTETDANGNTTYDVFYKVGNYGQRNYLNYTNDDGVTENLGRGSFTIENENLDHEKEVLTVPFSGTDYVLAFNWNERVPYIPRWDSTGALGDQLGKRILLLDTEQNPTNQVNLVDGLGNHQLLTDYYPKARFINPSYTFNLGFNEGVLASYFDMLTRTLKRAIRLVLKMKLSAYDIASLNFLVPVYLKQFASYFYINRVNNYVASDRLTKVELIRIGTADNVIVAPSWPEILLNTGFTEGQDANGNPGFKYWLTVYRSWFGIANGVQYDYVNGSPDVLTQVLATTLTVGGVYEFKVTLTNYANGILDIYLDDGGGTTFPLITAAQFQSQGNDSYVVQYTATGAAYEYMIALQPSFDFDGALTFLSFKRVS